MKRLFSALTAWIFLCLFVAMECCAAFQVDGVLGNVEWNGTPVEIIVPSGDSSNCAVSFASMRTGICNDENAVYFVIMAICDGLDSENKLCGASVKIADSAAMTARADNLPAAYDTDLYSLDSRLVIGSQCDFVCEMRIGFKYGVPASTPMEIRIFDAAGEPSTAYFYVLINDEFTETTAKVIKAITANQTAMQTVKATKATKTTTKKRTTAATTAEETRTRYSRPERTRRETTVRQQTEKKTAIPSAEKISKTAKTAQVAKTEAVEMATTAPLKSAKAVETPLTVEPESIAFSVDSTKTNRKQTAVKISCGAGIAVLVIWALLPDKKKKP